MHVELVIHPCNQLENRPIWCYNGDTLGIGALDQGWYGVWLLTLPPKPVSGGFSEFWKNAMKGSVDDFFMKMPTQC